MRHLAALIRNRPVVAYFVLTFAISWGGLLALGGLSGISSAAWQSDPRLPLLFVAMLAGPSISGLVMTAIVSGRAGFGDLGARLLRWRVGAAWYGIALLTAPVVFIAVHLALSLVSPVFLPAVLTMGDTASLLMFGLGGALVVGVLEELGWTGFAIPRLRIRHAATATGFIVGVPWGAWHLLTNDIWIAGGYSGDLSPATFVVLNGLTLLVGQLPAFRVLMVWVYDRTGSLPVAMLMHTSLSASTFIIGPEKVTGLALVGSGVAFAIAWWIVVALFAAATRARVARPRKRAQAA